MKAPLLSAWVRYMLAYLAVAVPVRLLSVMISDAPGRWSDIRAMTLAGLVLLPVSYVCFQWSVGRLRRADRGAEAR